jgi:hypothetical protein
MKNFIFATLVALAVLAIGCDTPWAAAKRDREGISWGEWQQGIRTREQKETADRNAQIIRENARELDIQQDVQRREKYIAEHPNLAPEIAQGIASGRLVRGMNAEEVRLIWGRPESVNRSAGAWGEREQWVFAGRRYAYLLNGRLESWQTTE